MYFILSVAWTNTLAYYCLSKFKILNVFKVQAPGQMLPPSPLEIMKAEHTVILTVLKIILNTIQLSWQILDRNFDVLL